MPALLHANRTPYDFGDFTLTIGDGWQILEMLRGPCAGDVYRNRQFFSNGPGEIEFIICDGSSLKFTIGQNETSAALLTIPVVHWDGRFVRAEIDLIGLQKTDEGLGFLAESRGLELDLSVVFGTGVIQIPDDYLGEQFVDEWGNPIDTSEGIAEFYDETDFPRPRFYLVNLADITEADLLSGLLPKALQLELPEVEPYESQRLSPAQVPCPLYQFDFRYTVELPGAGEYLLVIELNKEDGFTVNTDSLVSQLQAIDPDSDFEPVNADSSIGTGEAAKRSFSVPFVVRLPVPTETVDTTSIFDWLPWLDSDKDMLPDLWEEEVFAGLPFDAASDEDSDGFDNFSEFFRGSDPNAVDKIRIFVKNFERDGAVEQLEFNKWWLGDNFFPRYQTLSWRIKPIQNYKGYDVYVKKVTQDGLVIFDTDESGAVVGWAEDPDAKLQYDFYADEAYCFVFHWGVINDDGDELDGIWEIDNGLDPTTTNLGDADTDGDGASDDWEIANGFDPADSDDVTDTLDADNDTLSDLREYLIGTDPRSEFTDEDIFPDGYEFNTKGLNPTVRNSPFNDFDNDGVDNHAEYLIGSSINLPDTDGDGILDFEEDNDGGTGDGMPDAWEAEQFVYTPFDESVSGKDEFIYLLDVSTDDSTDDPDLDDLDNVSEYQAGTNATRPDSDSDCIFDGFEDQHPNLDPLNGADWDDDEEPDLILNIHEFLLGFDPNAIRTTGNLVDDALVDEDAGIGDGMPDAWEASFAIREWNSQIRAYDCLKTLDWDIDDSALDYDGDTLSNLTEYQEGTNPTLVDSDGDGMNDDYEVSRISFGFDPNDASDGLPDSDFDNDTYSNLFEYVRGTDPNDPQDYPQNLEGTIVFDSPEVGYTELPGERLSIRVTATDPDSPVERVVFFINDVEFSTDHTRGYYDQFYSSSWTPESGVYNVYVRAYDEYGYYTTNQSSPLVVTVLDDVDNDRMPDVWEQANFGSLEEAASADYDLDTIPNVFEYNHGTNPADNPAQPELYDRISFSEEQTGEFTYFIVDPFAVAETLYRKRTLSAAISRAGDFDVIEVLPGTYNEALSVYDRLYVFSRVGASKTIISAIGLDSSCLRLQAESVFEGFTFSGASTAQSNRDGAIDLYISGDQNEPRFLGCRIVNNRSFERGAAIYLNRGRPQFYSCTIAGNSTDVIAGESSAIYIANRDDNLVTYINTLVWNSDCMSEVAGAVDQYVSNKLMIRDILDLNDATVLIDGNPETFSGELLSDSYRLVGGSVAIDEGDTSVSFLTFDADGEIRVDSVSGLIDIGADEFYDSDGDSISDIDENEYYLTDATASDSDRDELSDYDEIFQYGTDPRKLDSDGDSLSDYEELMVHSSDPTRVDSDGDGMPDYWEVKYAALNVSVADAATNSDGDTISNLEEFQFGTDPSSDDSDSDGLKDHEEIFTYKTNPMVADSDNDGLLDGVEVGFASPTDPLLWDSDKDGMPDGWEVANLLDPLVGDAVGNPDADDYTNIQEYRMGSDPQLTTTPDSLDPVGLEVHTDLEL